MPDAQQHVTTMSVPRETVEEIVRNVHAIMALEDRRKLTQAELIRWCLQALRRPAPAHPERKAEWRRDMLLAPLYLEWLATQLEDAGHKKSSDYSKLLESKPLPRQ